MSTEYEIYSGAGNDFVMINNFDGKIKPNEQKSLTIELCEKNFPKIDGVIFVDKPSTAQASLRMNYFNRDGSFGAMCGNGARCTAMFAKKNNLLTEKKFNLEAVDKIYSTEILDDENVTIGFPPDVEMKLNQMIVSGNSEYKFQYVNVGSDHLVLFVDELERIDIQSLGSELRYHKIVMPKGANINFVKVIDQNRIQIRTYERGVERETLACGTGIISSAVVHALINKASSPVKVLVQSGEWLQVDFKISGSKIEDISLTGSARKISEDVIE